MLSIHALILEDLSQVLESLYDFDIEGWFDWDNNHCQLVYVDSIPIYFVTNGTLWLT
jgi:hypothetical protein